MNRHNNRLRPRKGATMILFLFSLVFLLALVMLVIDLSRIELTKVELKRAADAAALAATRDLLPDAMPHFPLKSPLGLSVNVPDVLKLELQKSLDTSVHLGNSKITLIDTSCHGLNTEPFGTAQKYAEMNSFVGLDKFKLLSNDVTVYARPDSPSDLLLLPLPLGGLAASIEKLLLVGQPDSFQNSVTVRARRDKHANGPVPLLFGSLVGRKESSLQQTSSATFYRGYGVRPGAMVLPIGMDITVWRILRIGNGLVNGIPIAQTLLAENGQPIVLIDEQTWNPDTLEVSAGSDGVWEVLLLNQPLDELKLPGLVDGIISGLPILKPKGLLNNSIVNNTLRTPSTIISLNFALHGVEVSTNQMLRQIQHGLGVDDIGENLSLPFVVYGNHSIPPAAVEELKEIIGQPRIIPLFETISGTAINKVRGLVGAKEPYRIVGFGGVVVTEVRDLGIVKAIKLQPASIMSAHVIPADPARPPAFSDCVFTLPVLCD